jgi:hypothetical protein
MDEWNRSFKRALVSGAAASLLSAAVLALAGRIERGTAAGPVNGPSQWVHGRAAAYRRRATLRHTLVGFLIHHAVSIGWATLHERAFGRRTAPQTLPRRLATAAITSSVANVVDFQLTPKRLRPGFEAQLSRKALFAVYTAFAVGLALYRRRGP